MAKIVRAQPSGFCMGVRRAVELVEKEIEKSDKIYTLGPIIHNQQVINDFKSRGVISINEHSSIAEGSRVIIRAHGVEPDVEDKLEEQGVVIIDGTCPKVRLSHGIIESYSEEGYFIVILGDKNHGEVKGLAGRAKKYALVSNPQEARELSLPQKTLFICQTTVKQDEFDLIKLILLEKNPKIIIKNTICPATMKRQEAVKKLSREVDAMVIVGGKGSANTIRLYQTALEGGIAAYHVEVADQLPIELQQFETIGVSAGASTPDHIIDEVIEKLRKL